MAKGQMRSNKEKKKPKADKNLKKGGSAPVNPFASGKPGPAKARTAKRTDVGLADRTAGTGLSASAVWRCRRGWRLAIVKRVGIDPATVAIAAASDSEILRSLTRNYISESQTVRNLAIPNRQARVLPIDRRAIRFTMGSTMRVGPNTGGENKMVQEFHRQRSLNFLETFYAGDIEDALYRCTDDVDFFANAPIDILPHMGHHHGKAEMRTMWETIHSRYSHMRYEVPIIVTEGDKVAANIRVFFRKSSNNRVVQFDIAAFYTFRDGRIAEIREIMDTFDLVQQVLERDVAAELTENKSDET